MHIQLEYKVKKFDCKIFANEKLICKLPESNVHSFDINELPSRVKIYINPYKIKPIIRIDKIMVNYGLAKITPWDHMLEFNLDNSFFDHYFSNIIEAKRLYLDLNKDEIEKKIGLDNLSELVSNIERNIS